MFSGFYFALVNHFSIIEFANIIVMLYNNELSSQSRFLIPDFSLLSLIQLSTTTIAILFKDFISYFFVWDINDKR